MQSTTKGRWLCQIIAFTAIFITSVALAITASYIFTGDVKAETAQSDSGIASLAAENAGIKQIAAGVYHTMILFNNGKLYAAGGNSYGQLGMGDTERRNRFTEVPGISDVTSVACKGNYTMVLSAGKLYATGDNSKGQLGLGDAERRNSFTEVPGISDVTSVVCGYEYTMAVSAGKLYGTGNNDTGQLGLDNVTEIKSFTEVPGIPGDVTAVACGRDYTMALFAGKLYGTGKNNLGQLGFGDVTEIKSFTEVPGISDVTSVACGMTHTMAVSAGKLYATGDNRKGELGLGDVEKRKSFTELTLIPGDVTLIMGGMGYTMAVSAGKLYATGDNNSGQLGLGDVTGTKSLTEVPGIPGDVTSVMGGYNYTIAISAGKLYGTGSNGNGQLGLYGTTGRNIFTAVPMSYTVSFDANGGTGTMVDQVITYGAYAEALTVNAFTRIGYDFAGWATEANGEKVYDNTANIPYAKTLGTSIKLYALWTLSAPAVSIGASASEATYGETVTLTADITMNPEIEYKCQWYKDGSALAGKTDMRLVLTEVADSGSYTVKVTATDGAETKSSTSAAQSVTINHAVVETPTIASKTYNGSTQTADITESERYTVTANKGGTTSGKYNVGLTLRDADNYRWADNTAVSGEKNETASLKFVIAPREIAVKIDDKSSVYGEAQAELTYTITSGEIVAGDDLQVALAKAAGDTVNTYAITGEGENTNYNVAFTNGVYEITKATYDMTNVKFEDSTITYDGQAQKITISGSLPAGVTVTYENNGKTNAGVYTVTAKFTGDADNYELISDKTATLTINKAIYDMSGITFGDRTVTYNGEAHIIEAADLPAGVTVTYENNGKINAGSYEVTATFTGDTANYELITDIMTATLTINKAVYDMSGVTFENVTVTAVGEAHSPAVGGTLPAGVMVTYENNGKTDAGEYTVTAKFTGDADNYEPIPDMTAKLTIEEAAEKGGCSGCGGVIDGATLAGAALVSLAFGLAFAVRKLRNKNR